MFRIGKAVHNYQSTNMVVNHNGHKQKEGFAWLRALSHLDDRLIVAFDKKGTILFCNQKKERSLTNSDIYTFCNLLAHRCLNHTILVDNFHKVCHSYHHMCFTLRHNTGAVSECVFMPVLSQNGMKGVIGIVSERKERRDSPPGREACRQP